MSLRSGTSDRTLIATTDNAKFGAYRHGISMPNRIQVPDPLMAPTVKPPDPIMTPLIDDIVF